MKSCEFCLASVAQDEEVKIIKERIHYLVWLIKKEGYVLKDPVSFTLEWFSNYLFKEGHPISCLKLPCRTQDIMAQEKVWRQIKEQIIRTHCVSADDYITSLCPLKKTESIILKYKNGLLSRKEAIMKLENCTEEEAEEIISKIEEEKGV